MSFGGGNNLWIGSLPEGIDEESFASIFNGYENVVSTKVFPDKWYGFVEFGTAEEATQVAAELDGAVVGGKGIKVRVQEANDKGKSKGGAPATKGWGKAAGKGKQAAPYAGGAAYGGDAGGGKGGGSNVWIGSLPDGLDDDSFRAIVEPFGTIKSTKLVAEKWYGFASFATPEEAQYAVESLEGAEYMGKPLKVKLATPSQKGGDAGGGKAWAKGGYDASAGYGGQVISFPKGGKAMGGGSKGKGKDPWGAPAGWAAAAAGAECAAGQGAHCASHYHIIQGQNPAFSRGTKEGNLYVKNLPEPADDLLLYKLFAPFGQVLSVCTKQSAAGWSIGFVQFETAEQADAAVGYMNGKETSSGTVLDCSIKK